jgi:hypothetical protein
MRRRRARRVWGGRIAAAVVLAGLAVYLFAVGLDRADKLAGVLGVLVAAVALVAPYVLPSSDHSSSSPSSAPESKQSVANTTVGGHLVQVRDVHDIRVRDSGRASPPLNGPAENGPRPDMADGQYVNGVWVGGNLTQIDGVDGDVTLG